MAFNGSEAEQVTVGEAAAWTKEFRDNMAPGSILAHFFGRDVLLDILNQEGCMGIRMYTGQEEDGTRNLVLVGADANENDIVTGVIAERSVKCPNVCGIVNVLNT